MTKVDRHMDICKGLNKIYEQKNHDYGDSFHDTFVEEGMAMARIRLSDKLNRFKKLSKADSEQKVNDESIRDTLLDLANYAIMTVMEMDIQAEEDLQEVKEDPPIFCPICGSRVYDLCCSNPGCNWTWNNEKEAGEFTKALYKAF